MRRHVEGMLVVPAAGGKSQLGHDEFRSTPIVTLDRPILGEQFSSILVDNKDGAKLGTLHLIGHKHKRICYLGLSHKAFTHRARYQGYREAMLRSGLVPQVYFNCSSREETLGVLCSLLSGPKAPTALFAGNNVVMRHLLHALSEMRVAIPADVAVAGFDDFDMADIFHPALTVVRQPDGLGRVAANLLFERLGARRDFQNRQIVLPVELIVRHSCGCKAVKAPSPPNAQRDVRWITKRKALKTKAVRRGDA